ncbi:MAG: hypothetical protein ACJ77B_08380 [Chloroflexota bacterium]
MSERWALGVARGDLYPSKAALDEAIASAATSWNPETFDQLDELLVKLGTSTGSVA